MAPGGKKLRLSIQKFFEVRLRKSTNRLGSDGTYWGCYLPGSNKMDSRAVSLMRVRTVSLGHVKYFPNLFLGL